ncbi:septum formation initiator family protein [candidate division KSB1 bacterium]|nr:septum formation initiator family protein [candidate division KSB1 bacterium]NIR68984.1 septum formation initiator family protein [candidate division KSB1 bacterium]NIS22606.1 septum formation initiator family protein [candidate division KSB1 bacterium]NIT69466.1 septum formation initiator family protein [candidate division KSB1 bacterium]NIU23121.1 septum formation initiator family protein [candidate division KSB1 bacterium]
MKSKKKLLRRLFLGVSLVIVFYLSFGGDYSLYKLWKLERKKENLQARIKENQQKQKQLSREIKLLRNDSTYIEKVARERFNMGRKGEKIYLLKEKDKDSK